MILTLSKSNWQKWSVWEQTALVCVGQTPGCPASSQTAFRPRGFPRSSYVPLQLLLAAFVPPTLLEYSCSVTAACSSGGATPALLPGTSPAVPSWNPGTDTDSTESRGRGLGVTAAVSRGSRASYSAHRPSLKNLRQQKVYKPIIRRRVVSHTHWVVTQVLCPASVSYTKKANVWSLQQHKLSSHLTKRTNPFSLDQNYERVAAIRNITKLTVI